MIPNGERTGTPTFWAAPDVVKAGYPVFPVGLDKAPSVPGGFYAATKDVSQIATWIEDGRADHDIAIPTGLPTFTVVIDADTTDAYTKMEERYGAPHVRTRRGGHWYFGHPQDGKVTSRRFASGLDCKADGAYVVIPPSRNRSWTHGIPNLDTLPKLPEELKQRLREERAPGGQVRCGAGSVGGEIPDGNRNDTLASLAGTMRRRGMGEAEIFAALEVTNRLRCKPPIPVEEVQRIVQSVTRYEPASTPWWVKAVSKNA
jgi:Bifunctional DNA primase/polymerase, N-terminal/Primase C terminal 1 (PriCT-1)